MTMLRKSISGILLLLFIISVWGCGEKSKSEPSKPVTPVEDSAITKEPVPDTESKPVLEIIDDKFETVQNIRYVVGTVKNNTSNKFKFVQVEIDFFDQFGTLVESELANSNDLEPNGSWKFKVTVKEKSAETYKFRDITRL